MRVAEGTGKTVEEAKAQALAELGIAEADAEIEVLQEEQRGLLGGILGGSAAIRVRATARESLGGAACSFLGGILDRMDLDIGASVTSDDDESAELEMAGPDIAIVIGRRGETIDALQLLTGVVASRRSGSRGRVVLNAEGYRERREKALENLACSSAAKVKQTGKEVVIPDLRPYERRVIHLVLADDPDVHTYSEGEGRSRTMIVSPGPAPETPEES